MGIRGHVKINFSRNEYPRIASQQQNRDRPEQQNRDRPECCYFKEFQRQILKPFTEGREGRKGSATAAGGALRAPSGIAGTGLSTPTLEPGGLRRLARRSAEREGGFFPSCPSRPSVKFLTVP
jgi:hypothetical protein